MGNIAGVHTNAFQKERLGWLSGSDIRSASSGVFSLSPLSVPIGSTRAVKVSANGTTYYVEVRNVYGFDGGAASGVIVHTGAGDQSHQIDMDPIGGGFDSILDPGQSFTTGGFTVRTIAADQNGATVEIAGGGGSEPPPPPPPGGCIPRGKSGKCK
jgi:hypothetical protein